MTVIPTETKNSVYTMMDDREYFGEFNTDGEDNGKRAQIGAKSDVEEEEADESDGEVLLPSPKIGRPCNARRWCRMESAPGRSSVTAGCSARRRAEVSYDEEG